MEFYCTLWTGLVPMAERGLIVGLLKWAKTSIFFFYSDCFEVWPNIPHTSRRTDLFSCWAETDEKCIQNFPHLCTTQVSSGHNMLGYLIKKFPTKRTKKSWKIAYPLWLIYLYVENTNCRILFIIKCCTFTAERPKWRRWMLSDPRYFSTLWTWATVTLTFLLILLFV